jgi:uncharacterized protein YbjT (DUF2867 family)
MRPVALIIGATGQVGRYIARDLESKPGDVHLRLAVRRADQVERLRTEARDVVFLDLDDPLTFPSALAGADRVFLLTGYSVAMLAQSKTLIDAARKAGVDPSAT